MNDLREYGLSVAAVRLARKVEHCSDNGLMNTLQQLLDFLTRLDSSQIQYRLECVRDAIMVVVPTPSKYFEIEFFADGAIEMQTFGPQSLVKSTLLDEITSEVVESVNGE